MKATKAKKVIVEPYAVPIYIATSDEAWELLELDRDDCIGSVLTYKGRWYVALPEVWDESTTWHEAHHIARMLNDHHGVITTGTDHEIDAYLQEHIVRLIKKHCYRIR
jgi:hypothetical protein